MAIIAQPGTLREIYGEQFNRISTLQIDVTQIESHALSSTVTDKPVEDGTTIADNVILNNARITITGILTDDRLGTSFADKWNALLALRRSREPFTVTTSLGAYPDMVFTEIRCNREVSTAGAVFFEADMVAVRIIESETAQVPLRATPEPARQAPAQDAGKKQLEEEVAAAEEKTERSIAAQLADKVLGE